MAHSVTRALAHATQHAQQAEDIRPGPTWTPVSILGGSQLEKNMAQVFACRKMWEMSDAMQTRVLDMKFSAMDMHRELSDMKDGCEDMRVKMEDGVALVCSDVGCACSQALVRRGGNRVFAVHVRARTI